VFEILAVLVLLLLVFSVFVLPILIVFQAAQRLFEPAANEVVSAVQEVRQNKWSHADAFERERMVRAEGGCRIIERGLGAGCCVFGAVLTVPTLPLIMFAVGAYRVLKPMRQEIGDACSYRSTGADDEPPFCW
jgi:hypothetical protein